MYSFAEEPYEPVRYCAWPLVSSSDFRFDPWPTDSESEIAPASIDRFFQPIQIFLIFLIDLFPS